MTRRSDPAVEAVEETAAVERAVLGAMLLGPIGSVDPIAVAVDLEPEHFYVDAHRLIFEAILTAISEQLVPDQIAVAAILRRQRKLARVGGVEALSRLVDATPALSTVAQIVRLIIDAHGRRRQIEIVDEARIAARDDDRSRLGRAARDLLELASPPVTPVTRNARDAARHALRVTGSTGDGIRTGDVLMTTVFPELRWCLPKLIPEGFTLAVGAPKIGKSWLLLQLALAAASGGTVLGEHLVPRPVLYLALEDSDRRLHARAASLGYGVTDAVTLAGFSYLTAIPPGRNVRDLILDWVDAQSDEIAPLVLVDTFGRVKGARATQAESQYDHEYRIGAAFKAIADDVPGMPLVASHHDRKAASTDFVDDVSGTNGLAGSADTILLLRRDRHSDDGVIQVTGRDVEEDAFAVNLSERGKWTLIGGDWTASRSSAIELMATTGRGDLAASIVAWLRTNVSGTPNEIADALGMGNNTIRQSLYRMRRAGVVDSDDRHHHFLPASSNEVAS